MRTLWATHEEDFLRKFYVSHGPLYCSQSLARPLQSVRSKASTLGVAKISTGGFDCNKEATLYFVSFFVDDIQYYKLGITNLNPQDRLRADWNKFQFKLIWSIKDKGYIIKKLEQDLLLKNSEYLINTGALLSGNTETLSVLIDNPTKELI